MVKSSADNACEIPNITQENVHGDNINGDKVCNLGVNTENLDVALRDIFNNILLFNVDEARKKINVLDSIQAKSASIYNRVKITKILLNSFIVSDVTEENLDFLKTEMVSTNTNIDNKGIATATFIYHLIQKDRKKDALNIYNDSDTSNYYINSIHISNLIDEDGINESIKQLFRMTTVEKEMLAIGCGISGNEEQCELLVEDIDTLRESLDKNFVILWLRRRLFILKLANTQYYLLTVGQKKWLNDFIMDCEQVIKYKKYDVRYVINIFLSLFNYVDFNDTLLKVCVEFEDRIKIISYDLWLKLAFQCDEVICTEQDLWIYRYRQSDDKEYTEKIISEIKSKSVWTNDEVNYFIHYGDFDDIDIQSVRVEGQNDAVSTLSKTRLLIQSGQFDETKLLIDIQQIEDIENITLEFILITCRDFFQKGLFSLINNLLSRIVHKSYNSLWCSPVVTIYAQSLFNAKQYKTFNYLISQVDSNNWGSSFYYMKALIAFNKDKIDKSLRFIGQAIQQDPYALEYWRFHCHLIINDLIDNKNHLFDLLPDNFFQKPIYEIIYILNAMTKIGRTSQVEGILCEFFINSPKDSSVLLTQFYLGVVPIGVDFIPSQTVKNVVKAVRYSNYDKIYRKLIIDSGNINVNNEYVLLKDTELARNILSLEVDETISNHLGELTLLEEYPPLALAFEISSEIRQSINDGSDPFRSIPFDINDIEKSKKRIINITKSTRNEEIIRDKGIPYFLKSRFLFNHDVVRSALSLMQNEYTAGQLSIFNHGKDSNEFIIDVHAFVYLILTGLFKPLIEKNYKILISKETNQLIRNWLDSIEGKKDIEGGVSQIKEDDFGIVSNNDIYYMTEILREKFKILLNHANILSVLDVDLPLDLVRITNQDYMDVSLSSSLESAVAHDKPILLLDMLLAQYANTLEIKVLNSSNLVSSLTQIMNFEDKKNGLACYATYELPFNVLFDDVYKLLLEGGDSNYYLISNIIRKAEIQESEYTLNFLKNFLILTLDKLYLTHLIIRFQYNLESQRALIQLINSIFRTVLNMDSQVKAEVRVARLIYNSINDKFILNNTRKLLIHIVCVFCRGHFLSIPTIVNEIQSLENCLFEEVSQDEAKNINNLPIMK